MKEIWVDTAVIDRWSYWPFLWTFAIPTFHLNLQYPHIRGGCTNPILITFSSVCWSANFLLQTLPLARRCKLSSEPFVFRLTLQPQPRRGCLWVCGRPVQLWVLSLRLQRASNGAGPCKQQSLCKSIDSAGIVSSSTLFYQSERWCHDQRKRSRPSSLSESESFPHFQVCPHVYVCSCRLCSKCNWRSAIRGSRQMFTWLCHQFEVLMQENKWECGEINLNYSIVHLQDKSTQQYAALLPIYLLIYMLNFSLWWKQHSCLM